MMVEQQDLLSWEPPKDMRFLGSTFDDARDRPRLSRQLKAVHDVMLDGKRRSLRQLADDAGALLERNCPEASASARFRDLRRLGFPVRDENGGAGLWWYWMELERPPPS